MNCVQIKKNNFIYQIINKDIKSGKCIKVHTRFPPEPNGYLHIGHAKSIFINFSIAQDFCGKCNLRFDDTNPIKENIEYVKSIQKDIKWLGFHWNENVRYASDYFEQLYYYALELIKKNLAYVDELSQEKIKEYRGDLINPGKNSPYRNRSIKNNLFLFSKMRDGLFLEGSLCLRAKIDMSSPFMTMRDPVLYRIKFSNHHQTGKKWCIYPMYDFAHCISDALEGITHSLCTLEFQNNRQLYNWILDNINLSFRPRQYEFSRLNLEYTVLSKRKLKILVEKKIVDGWDDPRMPTISGLRRRGYTASAIRDFCYRIGVTKQDSNIEIQILESCIRDDLNKNAPRAMAVTDPLKIVIDNLPDKYEEEIIIKNHPNKVCMGVRSVIFSREIFIDRFDFSEEYKKKYRRLILGEKVRLRNSYIIKAHHIEKNSNGLIKKVFCKYDQKTLGKDPDTYKVKGVIHWVSATKCAKAKFFIYKKLFNIKNAANEKDFLSIINQNSLIIKDGFVELSLLNAKPGESFQFERKGYYCTDLNNFSSSNLIFNRIINLRDIHMKNK